MPRSLYFLTYNLRSRNTSFYRAEVARHFCGSLMLLLITVLSVFSLLPCLYHCAKTHSPAQETVTWFFCDFPLTHAATSGAPAQHHHHAPPRTTFEPALVHLGLISTVVLLISRLFASASPLALHQTSAPPTPPPRAA